MEVCRNRQQQIKVESAEYFDAKHFLKYIILFWGATEF